jgi:hypothetical protein
MDPYKHLREMMIAEGIIGVTLVPGVGETMDIAIIVYPENPLWMKALAAGSLILNIATWGWAPNFGGATRASSLADEFVDIGVVGVRGADDIIAPGEHVRGSMQVRSLTIR